MSGGRRVKTLGVLIAVLVPVVSAAQGRGSRGGGFGTLPPTRSSPQTLSGFGTLPPAGSPRGDGLRMHEGPARTGLGVPFRSQRFGRGFGLPLIIATPDRQAAPAPTPYAVPYYYPVPVAVATASSNREPEVAAPPYDPTRSRILVIGAGADGGGGVMQLARPTTDSLRVTWLGGDRPVRDATLFLADASQQVLRSREVDLSHREALFSLTGPGRAVTYAGLTLVYRDGSTRTTLVPILPSSGPEPGVRRPGA